MKILVTGGAGFIGSHIVEYFHRQSEVRVLDNLRSGCRQNLVGLHHDFIQASILDRLLVRQAVTGVDYVFHLAAMISVPESVQKPDECREINTNGTLILLEESARAKVRKLVFSSSAAIYGNNPTAPHAETTPPAPNSPYASSKLAGENLCRQFDEARLLSTTCLRYFNVFGPRQNPRGEYAAVVPVFIVDALRHQPLTIYGDGGQTRDFTYVNDIVSANVFFATQYHAGNVINVASGRSIAIKELAQQICALADSRSQIRHNHERPGDIKHSLAVVEKLRATGFPPPASFVNGLKITIESFQNPAVFPMTSLCHGV